MLEQRILQKSCLSSLRTTWIIHGETPIKILMRHHLKLSFSTSNNGPISFVARVVGVHVRHVQEDGFSMSASMSATSSAKLSVNMSANLSYILSKSVNTKTSSTISADVCVT